MTRMPRSLRQKTGFVGIRRALSRLMTGRSSCRRSMAGGQLSRLPHLPTAFSGKAYCARASGQFTWQSTKIVLWCQAHCGGRFRYKLLRALVGVAAAEMSACLAQKQHVCHSQIRCSPFVTERSLMQRTNVKYLGNSFFRKSFHAF